jgi:hypothetical protein
MAKVIKKTSLDMRLNLQVVGGAQRKRVGGMSFGGSKSKRDLGQLKELTQTNTKVV